MNSPTVKRAMRGKPAPEASRLLESIDSDAVAQLTGFPAWSANVALAQAEIAYREGDVTTAREKLAIARPALMRPDAEPYTRRQVEKLGEALAAMSRK